MVNHSDYRSLLTEAYDLDKPVAPDEEIAIYREAVRTSGGPALEVMCGSGRLLLPLVAAGLDVDGVDASADMLDACRVKADRPIDGRLHLQRVQNLQLRRTYALVFCAAGSFGLLRTDEDVAAALRSCHDALEPGGTLLIDVESPIGPRPGGRWSGRWWRRPDGSLIVSRSLDGGVTADVEEALTIYELYVDGQLVRTELNEWVRRFWTEQAILDTVRRHGFVDVRTLDDTDPDGGLIRLSARRDRPSTT